MNTFIKDHQLLKLAHKTIHSYLIKLTKTTEKVPITEEESYASEVFISIENIISCIDQLYFSVGMLSGYRASTTPNQMNRHDYIVFGIENYYLRLTSVYDRCLRLTNSIYYFGLPERQCNNNTIVKNSHIKGTQIAIALKELDKFSDPFRYHRNTIAHNKSYSEKVLHDLYLPYLLSENDEIYEQIHHLNKTKINRFVAEKKSEYRESVNNIEKLVNTYFDVVSPAFSNKLKSYV
jgi:hypothetical protein